MTFDDWWLRKRASNQNLSDAERRMTLKVGEFRRLLKAAYEAGAGHERESDGGLVGNLFDTMFGKTRR